ncbi:glycosyltransferase family 4 protein [Mycolicibacterium sp. P1-5]|uniref:glycosyltransferase family 4 protein n=1 Tax=Mycolicibacterium sp. P1-5 TaxID=2024617 RepID=UPI0011EE106A|nr:glycosyltransferase family 4 protein [Mycolicibacterium sp. P1-5]KAA0110376.1 glycosyltransferase WbuB [Mycolicibacterium sp. P1-5]
MVDRLSNTPLRPAVSILSLNYPPEPTGIAPYTGTLSIGLDEMGYPTTAHVAHPHYPDWKIHDGYGEWTRVGGVGNVGVIRRLHYVPRSPRGLQRLVSELTFGIRLMFARLGSPNVIIAVSPSLFATALTAVRLKFTRRRPCLIVWVQDIYTLGMAETGQGNRFAKAIIRWVESLTLNSADRVVVIHERFADFVTQQLGVVPAKVAVVRNWTHLPTSTPVDAAAAKKSLGWSADVTLAFHTGNMGAKQGLENIVEAAREADRRRVPVHFVLVGAGSERQALRRRADGVARITFVDPLGVDDYKLALAAADVLLVNEKPGVSAMAVPSKLTSYFDARRPIIAATDPRGITAAEIAASGAGVVVPAGDPGALLDAVLAVGADSEGAARFAANGRYYRETVLGQESAIDQWAHIIDDITGT